MIIFLHLSNISLIINTSYDAFSISESACVGTMELYYLDFGIGDLLPARPRLVLRNFSILCNFYDVFAPTGKHYSRIHSVFCFAQLIAEA